MPPNQDYEFSGPWGGISNLVSAKQIIPSDLASASNVTNVGGRLAPRPGYLPLTDAPLSIVQQVMIGYDSITTETDGLAMDQSNGRIYFSVVNTVRSISVNGGAITTEFTGAGTAVAKIGLTVGSYLYYTDPVTRTIRRVDWTTWLNPTTLVTLGGSSVPNCIAVDTVNSKIWYGTIVGGNAQLRYCAIGGGADTLGVDLGASTYAPIGIAVDSTGTYVYLGYGPIIKRLNCSDSGTTNTTLYTSGTATNGIQGIALDESNSYVYYNERTLYGFGYLRRMTTAGASNILWHSQLGTYPNGLVRHNSTNRFFVGDTLAYAPKAGMYRITAPGDFQIISSFWINRSVLDVDESAGEYSKDIVLLQLISSTYTEQKYIAFFPTSGIKYALDPGYNSRIVEADRANTWVSLDRTTAISTSYANNELASTSGRATFAWTGAGLNTGKGGLLIADGDNQWVFNYVLGDTIQTVEIGSGGGGDTFTLTYGTETTASLAWNASAATVKDALEDLLALDGVVVTLSGTTYTIRFVGALSGQDATTLTGTGTGCTVTIVKTQAGGTDTDATLYLRPVGLPMPTSLTATSVGVASGIITGYYEYYATFYSSTWDIESPPSSDNALALMTSESVDMTITAPSTMYFEGTAGATYTIANGPLIDFWRLYRRKRGSYAGGSTGGGDGVDADPTWYFIAQTPIASLTYRDNNADTAKDFASPLPINNEYPPQDAQWVEICNGRSVWASARSEDRNVWPSELQKAGGVANGELGFEYVSDFKFFLPEFLAASDTPITGMKSYQGVLYIGTEKEVVATTLDGVDDTGPSVVRLRGTTGWASQWMIAESSSLPDAPGNLFWVSPNGWVYSFNGSQTQLLSRKIDTTSRTFARQYWHATSYFPSAFTNNWYWCSGICDPIRNKFLFTAPVDGSTNIIIDYSLDAGAWYKWAIPAYALVIGREWSGSTGKGEPLVCLADGNGYFHKLKDGKADNGTSFAWSFSTGKLDFSSPVRRKMIHEGVLTFDVRSFGGSNPTVTIAAGLNDNATPTTSSLTVSTASQAQAGIGVAQTYVRHLQLTLSGTHTTDLSHPELIGLYVGFEPDTGSPRN